MRNKGIIAVIAVALIAAASYFLSQKKSRPQKGPDEDGNSQGEVSPDSTAGSGNDKGSGGIAPGGSAPSAETSQPQTSGSSGDSIQPQNSGAASESGIPNTKGATQDSAQPQVNGAPTGNAAAVPSSSASPSTGSGGNLVPTTPGLNLGSAKNSVPSAATPAGTGGKSDSGAGASSKTIAPSAPPAPAEPKPRPNFPGIEQSENEIMVSEVRHKAGEGEDHITVTLTRIEGTKELEGVLWVIGEYIQRGTTGVMYMPSHNELKVAADGKPKFPNNGMKFQMRTGVEKKLTVRRPGFEGEELIGVKIGVIEKTTGKFHQARVSMRQIQKKSAPPRAKVKAP